MHRFEADPERASVSGFDHWRACSTVGLVALAVGFAGPLLVGDRRMCAAGVAAVALAWLSSLAFRYRVDVSRERVRVSRSWFGCRYSSVDWPPSSVRFEVLGTGEAGEEGDWPCVRYCAVVTAAPSESAPFVGSPGRAAELADFLEGARARLRA